MGPSDSHMARLSGGVNLLALAFLVGLGLAACSDNDPGSGTKQDVPVEEDGDTPEAGDLGKAELPDAVETDTLAIQDGADSGEPDDAPDVPAVIACTSDDWCALNMKAEGLLKPCETGVCNATSGKCEAKKLAGKCCTQADCDDANKCTDEVCNAQSALCEYTPKPNCCKDQIVLLDEGFEGSAGEFKDSCNGQPVSWRVDNANAQDSKYSLYFGNDCKTYDTYMTPANGCKFVAGLGKPVFCKLESPQRSLPAGTQSIAHFWLWLATEPMYTESLEKGSCPQGCPSGVSCVKIEGVSQCVPEKDVLRLKVLSEGNTTEVWNSTTIGKSTKGKWQHIAVDLSTWTGKGVKLIWEFDTKTGQKNEYEGIYIDDVVIETLCVGESGVCKADAPCKDDANPCSDDGCTWFVNGGKLGVCFHDRAAGCCVKGSDCDDKNDCTLDSCAKPEATAAKGACKNVPDAENAQCCQEKALFKDDFESGSDAAWEKKNANSKTVLWQVTSKEFFAGKSGLYFGDAAGAGYDDPSIAPKGPKGTVCSPKVKLAAGTLYDVLSLQLKIETEWSGKPSEDFENPKCPKGKGKCTPQDFVDWGLGKIDEFKVQLQVPSGLVDLWSSDSIFGSTEGKWLPLTMGLDKYQGKEVQVCFTFDAGDQYGNKKGGVWIDDVRLDVACKEQACSFDAQCADKAGPCQTAACASGQCKVSQKPECCVEAKDCDDADTCTTDTCKDGKCEHAVSDPKCCSKKTVATEGFEGEGKLPAGWTVATKKGAAAFGGGKLYSQTMLWDVSPLKAKTGTFSLYFGKNGTFNAGDEVPAAVATGPELTVPGVGTTLASFDLFLSTEWNDIKPFMAPGECALGAAGAKCQSGKCGGVDELSCATDADCGLCSIAMSPCQTKDHCTKFVIDLLSVGVLDTAVTDPKKAVSWLWDSYAITGSTHGKWASVVANLTPFAGKKVRLVFDFDAGTVKNNAFEGAYVDNLQVETLCGKIICWNDAMCAPDTPDKCKSYTCGKNATSSEYECTTAFKAGPGCCESGVALPLATFEAGDMGKWSALKASSGTVKWQATKPPAAPPPPIKLGGDWALYFGNILTWNYADGDKPVSGFLKSNPFTPSSDLKKASKLKLKAWIDIEPGFEIFQIFMAPENGGQCLLGEDPKITACELIWDHKTKLGSSDYKKVINIEIDLLAWKGKSWSLVVKFDSGDGKNNDKNKGIFLDDIVIDEPCQ